MGSVLELREVSKAYPGCRAVDRVSLEVPRGSFFSLLGPSGCGKTTTLRLIAGFEPPDAGEIRLNGNPIQHLKPYQRNVSTVFQSYALFPHLSVRGNIEFGLKYRKVADRERRVRQAIEMVRLSGKEDRRPAEISGGEKQRVALARSLVIEPDLLLLDEPLAALDAALRKQMRSELKQLQRRLGITFLFVTHDQEEAMALSDRMAVMRDGRIEQVGSPEEIYRRPRTRFVAGFLGAINWVNGTGVGVRPEATRVARGTAPEGSRSLDAVVLRSTFLGNLVQVEARTPGGQCLLAELPGRDGVFSSGERVTLWWRPDDEMTFPGEDS